MNLAPLFTKLGNTYAPISTECQKEFIENAKIKTYDKGEIVVREGQYSRKAHLIIDGCARAYYLKDDKDISDWFTFENQFIAPIISFFSNQPSPHFVEFVEKSTVLEFSKETVDLLTEKHHDFERLISRIVTETMLGLCERLHTIQFSKAEERYKQLISIYPDVTQRIPLTHIASYLGISLETLSRVRNPKYRI